MHLTTLTHWAVLWDAGLLYFCPKNIEIFAPVVALIFISKWIKFVGHYLRYPVDVLLLPVSILFGYFHGFFKLYAACTLHIVSWRLTPTPHVHDASITVMRGELFAHIYSTVVVLTGCVTAHRLLGAAGKAPTLMMPIA